MGGSGVDNTGYYQTEIEILPIFLEENCFDIKKYWLEVAAFLSNSLTADC